MFALWGADTELGLQETPLVGGGEPCELCPRDIGRADGLKDIVHEDDLVGHLLENLQVGLAVPVCGNLVNGIEGCQLFGPFARELVGLVHDDNVEPLSAVNQLRGRRYAEARVVLHPEDVENLAPGLLPVGLNHHADHGILPLTENPRDHVGEKDRLARPGVAVDEVVLGRMGDDLPDKVRLLVGEDLDGAVLHEGAGTELIQGGGLDPALRVEHILPKGEDDIRGDGFAPRILDDGVATGAVDDLIVIAHPGTRVVGVEVRDELALDIIQ